ncbi:MAG: dienelactone hydrolase family protein [Gammaproteobacteria bacterium]|jgi:dienelactone hydrolase
MKTLISLFTLMIASLALVSGAHAEIRSETVTYQDGGETLTGNLYWDDSISGKRPGVLVVHEWWGLNEYARWRAGELARMGYVAFAADMYGSNKVTTHPAQAQEWMTLTTSNLGAWRQRALAGLEQLRNFELTDSSRMAAIGYCFGGATVMQLAYAGADLKGVVSFHGSLPPPNGDEASKIKARVLVEHGNADAFVPAERVRAFKTALNDAGVDLTFHGHDGARHAFTNPDAGNFGIDNLKYDPAADESSWQSMQQFFRQIF